MSPALLTAPFNDLVEPGDSGRVEGLLRAMATATTAAFGLDVAPQPGTLPVPLPARAYDSRREQYEAAALLAALARRSDRRVLVLGVTGVDIFAPRLNFVFGMADRAAGVAVISLYRLAPEFYGEAPDPALYEERATREAVHELGHLLGLSHCSSAGCIMRFSSTIADTDEKGPGFCSRCAASLTAAGPRKDETGAC